MSYDGQQQQSGERPIPQHFNSFGDQHLSQPQLTSGRSYQPNYQTGSVQNSQYNSSYPPSSRSYSQGPYQSSGRGSSQSYRSSGRSSSQFYQQSSRGYSQQSGRSYSQQSGRSYSQQSGQQYYEPRQVDEDYLARQLCSILRHKAHEMKLKMDSGGFVYVDDILKIKSFYGATLENISNIVKADNKERFCLKENAQKYWIVRANQGHSIKLENLDLKKILDPTEFPTVLHGTYTENWQKIRTQGLKTMGRNHIHFAPDLPGQSGVISGMRQSCDIMIYLDLEKAMKDGIKFFLSSNNVILSNGNDKNTIGSEYFVKVVDSYYGSSISLTEPIKTTSSAISDRVAFREGQKKTAPARSPNSIPGLNPVDDSKSEKTNSKSRKKNKDSRDHNVKNERTPSQAAGQTAKKFKVSEKQENHAMETKEQVKSQKPKRSGETKAAATVAPAEKQENHAMETKEQVKSQKPRRSGETKAAATTTVAPAATADASPNKKGKDKKEEVVKNKGNNQQEKNVKEEFPNSKKTEKPSKKQQNSMKPESESMEILCFDSSLEEELTKLSKIVVIAQNKLTAVGTLDKLIIFKTDEDNNFLQKLMNNGNIMKLIFPITCLNLKSLDVASFKKILDLMILYNEMNEKPMKNCELKLLYERSTESTSKSVEDYLMHSELEDITKQQKKGALSVWQTFEIYKCYEERLKEDNKEKNILKMSLENLIENKL